MHARTESAGVVYHAGMAPWTLRQVALAVAAMSWIAPAAVAEPVRFNRDIRPILSEFCFKCHGFDANQREAGLRLDTAEGAHKRLDSGKIAVRPGSVDQSALWHRITAEDADERMPPAETGKRPSAAQIQLLRRWIEEGGAYEPHWAFIAPRRPALPKVSEAGERQARTAIDRFIVARLERQGVTLSGEADRATLLRRIHLDLTGLPPSPQQVMRFVSDPSLDAYERAVESLLASPHFGERWARPWLDAARYADTDGYNGERDRPWAWRYRTWVIDAINADLPFDQFTIQQLAGDLLPDADADITALAATGFHRNTLTNRETGTDVEEYRVRKVVDQVNTTAAVWLGLTVGCAECHDHKYDPITQRDYYGLYAFFNSLEEFDAPAPLPGEPKALIQTLHEGESPRPTHIHVRGDFLRHGDAVIPAAPGALPPLESRGERADRLDLARWLVDPAHPLTARVAVNRIWQQLFGQGLVATDDDFGMQGEPPSHPELLDWLAVEFIESGWSRKHMIRLIVNSAAYRQSAGPRKDSAGAELARRDPLNRQLSRQNRLRLDAELVRDQAVAAAGLLDLRIGGRSFRPPVPQGAGFVVETQWSTKPADDRFRRGLYIFVQRTVPHPMLATFDAPDRNVTCTRRLRSNTPLQALTLLNDPTFVEAARYLGVRLINEADSDAARIRMAALLCWSRPPDEYERARLTELLQEQRSLYAAESAAAREVVGNLSLPPGVLAEEAAAWIGVARALMNTDAFIARE